MIGCYDFELNTIESSLAYEILTPCGIVEAPLVSTIVDGGNHLGYHMDDIFEFPSPMGTKLTRGVTSLITGISLVFSILAHSVKGHKQEYCKGHPGMISSQVQAKNIKRNLP